METDTRQKSKEASGHDEDRHHHHHRHHHHSVKSKDVETHKHHKRKSSKGKYSDAVSEAIARADERREKNKVAAAASRAKKKAYTSTIEEAYGYLYEDVATLRTKLWQIANGTYVSTQISRLMSAEFAYFSGKQRKKFMAQETVLNSVLARLGDSLKLVTFLSGAKSHNQHQKHGQSERDIASTAIMPVVDATLEELITVSDVEDALFAKCCTEHVAELVSKEIQKSGSKGLYERIHKRKGIVEKTKRRVIELRSIDDVEILLALKKATAAFEWHPIAQRQLRRYEDDIAGIKRLLLEQGCSVGRVFPHDDDDVIIYTEDNVADKIADKEKKMTTHQRKDIETPTRTKRRVATPDATTLIDKRKSGSVLPRTDVDYIASQDESKVFAKRKRRRMAESPCSTLCDTCDIIDDIAMLDVVVMEQPISPIRGLSPSITSTTPPMIDITPPLQLPVSTKKIATIPQQQQITCGIEKYVVCDCCCREDDNVVDSSSGEEGERGEEEGDNDCESNGEMYKDVCGGDSEYTSRDDKLDGVIFNTPLTSEGEDFVDTRIVDEHECEGVAKYSPKLMEIMI